MKEIMVRGKKVIYHNPVAVAIKPYPKNPPIKKNSAHNSILFKNFIYSLRYNFDLLF